MKQPPKKPPGSVRIISGVWRRTPIAVMDAAQLRPTADRLRESLFNWLGHDLHGWRVLDAFAGTGVLGFEAASRGATEVVFCENQSALVHRLTATRQLLLSRQTLHEAPPPTLKIMGQDVLAFLRNRSAAPDWDLIFLDPPFAQTALYAQTLALAATRLRANGVIYLEAARAWQDEELLPFGLRIDKQQRVGAAHGHLLRACALT